MLSGSLPLPFHLALFAFENEPHPPVQQLPGTMQKRVPGESYFHEYAPEKGFMEQKKVLSFPLRLSPSVRMQATELARLEGISLNHFISLAVAEKISRMEHESWLRQQGKTASSSLPLRTPILRRF